MKKRILVAAIVCLLTLSAAFAEESIFQQKDVALGSSFLASPDHYFYGLNFQRWSNDFGIDITAGGTYYEYYDSADTDINAEIKFQYSVYQSPAGEKTQARIYTWLMAGITGTTNSEYDASTNTSTRSFGIDFCGGFGFGAEVVLWKSLSIPVEFGFAGGFPNNTAFGYCFSTGIRYRM